MNAKPLSKEIYAAAVKIGVTKITLHFNGGSDEGYLDVTLSKRIDSVEHRDLECKVESWAWDVYEYDGAGDGNDYGDNIEYDLVSKKVRTSEWRNVREDGEPGERDIVFADGE